MKLSRVIEYAGIGLQSAAIRLLNKEASRLHLARKLGEIPGVPAKIGQLLGSRLNQSIPGPQTMDAEVVLNLLEKEVPNLYRDLMELEEVAQVASLSQVHRGVLRDGRVVAIKVQFPGIESELSEQLDSAFRMFERFGPAKKMNEDLSRFEVFFRNSLLRELNYLDEMEAQLRFVDFFKDDPEIVIPEVYPEYSCGTVLTQSYVSAQCLEALKSSSRDVRNHVSKKLIQFQLQSIFKFKMLHGDLHPGNWGYSPDQNALVIYDFGSTQKLSEKEVLSLIDLVRMNGNEEPAEFHQAWVRLGFDSEKLLNIFSSLKHLSGILTEPMKKKNWVVSSWNFSDRISDLLQNAKWWFRFSGPPWFLGLMKSCHGVVHALHTLDSRVSVAEEFSEILSEKFELYERSEPVIEVLSKHLRVLISENGMEVVSLEFPARSASYLDELIPGDARMKIKKEGIDLNKIAQKAQMTSFKPQTLFETKIMNRIYRVWLE